MLRRAILNLALNSVDAMPDGGQLVVTSCCGPHGLELEIADSGPGLSEAVSRRAFEPFFTTKSHGTGLGLAIVKHVVNRHRGRLDIQSTPGKGSTFTVTLPAARI